MQILELYTRLSFGELSNLAIGMEGAGTIRESDKMKVLSHVNDGLLDLYSRFLLSTKLLLVEQVAHITNYHLIPKFAESQNSVEYPYIKDLPGDPFTGDLIRIIAVHNTRGGEYILNDRENKYSLFTPSPQMLQVPAPVSGRPMYVEYQARHNIIKEIGDNTRIQIPFVLEAALQSFIAYKIFSNMNGQDNMLKGQEHFAAYERRCLEVEENDLVNTTVSTTSNKLIERGFV